MKLFGLIGHPLTHSFSKKFFTEKFERENIEAQYDLFDIDDIARFPEIVSQPEAGGINVTIPYKEQVIPYLEFIDEEAEAIGAVNVVKVERDGDRILLTGYNSDVYGFCESIRPLLREHHKKALVLGTGGASKAVCHGLRRLGVEPRLVSRTPAGERFTYGQLTPAVMEEYTVIVNTTPVGTYPHNDEWPDIPYHLLTPAHLLYDLVYNPPLTCFLEKGKSRGAAVKNGAEMLELQALKAWEIWSR
jgi:shikimate dehydrogenase